MPGLPYNLALRALPHLSMIGAPSLAPKKNRAHAALPKAHHVYTYDDLYRLTQTDNPALSDEAYTYDPVGNRLTSKDTQGDWSYNGNNELLGLDDISYIYDENGNTTQKVVAGVPVMNYLYDTQNRLIRVQTATGNVIAEYGYDPFGRRLWKEAGGQRTYFTYADEGLIGEYDAAGTQTKAYGYRPDSTWTTDPLFMKEGSEYYFFHNDHLGTPMQLTATNGAVVWAAQYNSFGAVIMEPFSEVTNNLRFAGQSYDSETGLYYNWHRYYDPKTGRYISADPIGLEGGINLFTYVLNNPITLTDPHGLQTIAPTTPIPLPLPPVFIPGTRENREFVKSVEKIIQNIKDRCQRGDDDLCERLNDEVQRAKKVIAGFGKGKAACNKTMSCSELSVRKAAWLYLATTRAIRDTRCWGGGDEGHQTAQADAWRHVGQCTAIIKQNSCP